MRRERQPARSLASVGPPSKNRAHFDRRTGGDGSLAPPRKCPVQISGFQHPKTAYVLLGLRVRPVGDEHLTNCPAVLNVVSSLVRLTFYRAHLPESMLEVLRDPLYPSAVDVALADGAHGQMAGRWIGHETGLDPIVLQSAKQLVGLGDRDAGIAGVGQ